MKGLGTIISAIFAATRAAAAAISAKAAVAAATAVLLLLASACTGVEYGPTQMAKEFQLKFGWDWSGVSGLGSEQQEQLQENALVLMARTTNEVHYLWRPDAFWTSDGDGADVDEVQKVLNGQYYMVAVTSASPALYDFSDSARFVSDRTMSIAEVNAALRPVERSEIKRI